MHNLITPQINQTAKCSSGGETNKCSGFYQSLLIRMHIYQCWKLQQCIISMSYFATLHNQHETFRISQLQSKISTNKTNMRYTNSLTQIINQPHDLKIISPFYKRVEQHPQHCKCMYHKRIRYEAKKIQKVKTQPSEIVKYHKENDQKQQYLAILPSIQSINKEQALEPQEFESWKKKLSTETLKSYYHDYLKSIANYSKFKRHQKLDCYNHAFEQFLKNNYLVILDRKKTQNEIKNQSKFSYRNLSKVKTEGNIETVQFTKKALQSSKENQTTFSQANINKYPSSRDGLKIKRIAFKSTGKQIESSCQQLPQTEKKEKKNFKKSYSSRPSFFGLIEDQQIIREICSRFIHQNKSENKEAQLMMKQLVDSDIEMYAKLMNDIKQNLQQGINFPNLDQQHALMLVKIVLQKMNREVHSKKHKDIHFGKKNSIIQSLCAQYGWGIDQKHIGLQQFWKITQSIKNVGFSRNSIGTQKETKYKDQRSKSPYVSSPKKQKNNSRVSMVSRMSGFSKDRIGKYFSNTLNSQTGSNISNKYLLESEITEERQEIKLNADEFKMKTARTGTIKKGVLVTKKKKKKLSGLLESDEAKKIYGLVRKETCFFQAYQGERQLLCSQQIIKQESHDKIVVQTRQYEDRNSSIYSNSKNLVLRHIESNKKFLKRIQSQLIGNDCNNLVIGIGTNVLTKKRKIRAIYKAISSQRLEYTQSVKYSNLLKYLEIYEEYCDLIVKMKNENMGRSEASMGKLSEPNLQFKEGQAEEITNLITDLSKERQLKYFKLKWLQQKEDPKQQLILKMPQRVNVRQARLEDKKKTKYPIEQPKPQLSEQPVIKEETIIQKGLEEQVNVYCQMGKPVIHQKSVQKQDSLPAGQKLSDFQLKILNYRKMLKLQEKE